MSIKNSYAEKAKALKKISALNPEKYDLRKPLDKFQKGAITKAWNKFGAFIEKPELFHAPVVGKKNAKLLKQSGFRVTKSKRAIIPLHGNDVASIDTDGVIHFKRKGVKTDTYLGGTGDIIERLEKLKKKKLGKNQMVTVRIGDRSPFATEYTNFYELLHYLQEEFEPNDEGEEKENLFPLMSIVTVDTPVKRKQKHSTGTKGTPVKARSKNAKKK